MVGDAAGGHSQQVCQSLLGQSWRGRKIRSVSPCHGLHIELWLQLKEVRELALRFADRPEPVPPASDEELAALTPEGFGWRVIQRPLPASQAEPCPICQGAGRVLCQQCWGSRRLGCPACGGSKWLQRRFFGWGEVHSLFGGSRRALVTMDARPLCDCTLGRDCPGCEAGTVACSACNGDGQVDRESFERICFYPERVERVLGMEGVPEAIRAREPGTLLLDRTLSESTELAELTASERASVQEVLEAAKKLLGERTEVHRQRLRLTRYCFWKLLTGEAVPLQEAWLYGERPSLPRGLPSVLARTRAVPPPQPVLPGKSAAAPPPLPVGSEAPQLTSFTAQNSSRVSAESAARSFGALFVAAVFVLGIALGALGLWSLLPFLQGSEAPGQRDQQPEWENLPLEDPGGD